MNSIGVHRRRTGPVNARFCTLFSLSTKIIHVTIAKRRRERLIRRMLLHYFNMAYNAFISVISGLAWQRQPTFCRQPDDINTSAPFIIIWNCATFARTPDPLARFCYAYREWNNQRLSVIYLRDLESQRRLNRFIMPAMVNLSSPRKQKQFTTEETFKPQQLRLSGVSIPRQKQY